MTNKTWILAEKSSCFGHNSCHICGRNCDKEISQKELALKNRDSVLKAEFKEFEANLKKTDIISYNQLNVVLSE